MVKNDPPLLMLLESILIVREALKAILAGICVMMNIENVNCNDSFNFFISRSVFVFELTEFFHLFNI